MNFKRLLVPVVIAAAALGWLFSVTPAEAQVDGETNGHPALLTVGTMVNAGTVSCSTINGETAVHCSGTIAGGTDYFRLQMTLAPAVSVPSDYLIRGLHVSVSGTQSSNASIFWMQATGEPYVFNKGTTVSWWEPGPYVASPDGNNEFCWARAYVFRNTWGYTCNNGSYPSTDAMNEWEETYSGNHYYFYMYIKRWDASNTIDLTITPTWVMRDPDPGAPITDTQTVTQTLGVFPCVVTTTETITNDSGITTTQTITYEIPDANLVQNKSFENVSNYFGSNTPDTWDQVVGGVVDYSFSSIGNSLPRTGSNSVYNTTDYELWGSADRVLSPGYYLQGFFASCATGLLSCDSNQVSLAVGSAVTQTIAGTVIGTYASYSDTILLGGGSPDIVLTFDHSPGYPYVFVDDVFLVPVDENGLVSCSADMYPPDEYYTDPIGSIPGPVGGAGTVCYQCTIPTSTSASAVSYWIAWLGCVLRNMFSCSLRVWLLIIGNWISGLINQGVAWIAWVPLTVYQAADWFNEYVLPAISSISLNVINTEAQTNGWDVLIALINLLSTIVSALSDILLGIVNFFGDLISIIPNAINAQPRYLTLDGTEYNGSGAIDVSGEGGSNNKAVYLFFMGIQWVDTILFANESVVLILYVAMGVATFLVIWWSAQFWSELISL